MGTNTRARRARPLLKGLGALALAAAGATACTTPPPDGGGNPGTTVPGGPTGDCANVEIITARGTGEAQGSPFAGLSGLNNGIAGPTRGVVYDVVYPASADFAGSPRQGVADALDRLTTRSAACPGTRFFLTGYSQGAMVVTGVFQQLPAALAAKVVGGVTWGNPFYNSASPTAAGPARPPARPLTIGIPASWGGKVREYCIEGDPVCGAGNDFAAHLAYIGSVQQREAVAWAVPLINGAG